MTEEAAQAEVVGELTIDERAESMSLASQNFIEQLEAMVEAKSVAIAEESAKALAVVESLGAIKTDEEDRRQKEMQATLKGELKAWEEERLNMTRPINGVASKLKGKYDASMEPARTGLGILNERIKKRYAEQQEASRKEQLRKDALAKRQREQAESKAKANGESLPEPPIPMPAVAQPAKTTKTAAGSVTVAEYWTCEIVGTGLDAVKAAVEANRLDLLLPNEKAAKAAVNAGVREIPGYRVYKALKV